MLQKKEGELFLPASAGAVHIFIPTTFFAPASAGALFYAKENAEDRSSAFVFYLRRRPPLRRSFWLRTSLMRLSLLCIKALSLFSNSSSGVRGTAGAAGA